MRLASQRFFIHSNCIYLRILTISYLATFLGTNSHSVMCRNFRKAVNQSINYHEPRSATWLTILGGWEYASSFILQSPPLIIQLLECVNDAGLLQNRSTGRWAYLGSCLVLAKARTYSLKNACPLDGDVALYLHSSLCFICSWESFIFTRSLSSTNIL